MPSPCADSRLPDPHIPARPDTCPICHLYFHDPKIREIWNRTGSKTHLVEVDSKIHNITVKGKGKSKSNDNSVTSNNKGNSNNSILTGYSDYPVDNISSPPHFLINKRHLIYYILPVKGNGVWRWNVDQLSLRWNLFNGEKVIAIAQGGKVKLQNGREDCIELDDIQTVKEYLPSDCHVIEVENNPSIREGTAWKPLWEKLSKLLNISLESLDNTLNNLPTDNSGRVLVDNTFDNHIYNPETNNVSTNNHQTYIVDDVIFYGHAKGTTRPHNITLEYGGTSKEWTQYVYNFCLDYWNLVENQFQEGKQTVSCFVNRTPFNWGENLPHCPWHYSCGMCWVKCKEFLHKVNKIPLENHKWCTEGWFGIAYNLQDEAGVVGPDYISEYDLLYRSDYWNNHVLPSIVEWKNKNTPIPIYNFKGNISNVVSDIISITGDCNIKEIVKNTSKDNINNNNPKCNSNNTSNNHYNVSLSIIVATKGRPSLTKTLNSITSQMLPQDELIIKFDNSDDWGATPRTLGMRQAVGTHLMFMDDDDSYTPDSFRVIRETLQQNPSFPHIFKMQRPERLIWDKEEVIVGNVSTQMIITPNNLNKLGVWGTEYEGDYKFIKTTTDYYSKVIFNEHIICKYRG